MKKKRWLFLLLALILLLSSMSGISAYTMEGSLPENPGGITDETFPVFDYEKAAQQGRPGALAKAADVLPSSYDLTEHSWISSIKNQGRSSLCWSFSAAAVVESSILKSGGQEMDYSEQHMAYALSRYTSESENGNPEGFDRQVNSAGSARMAQAYLSRYSGLVLEKDDPFVFFNESGTGTLRSLAQTREKPREAYVGDYINIPNPSSRTPEQIKLHRETVKRCLMDYGAVGMAFTINSSYYVTSTSQTAQGKGTLGNCYYDGTGNKGTNHLVTIVGWDDHYPRENFRSDKRPSADGAFKVKNSYGTDYNDQGGYFWLSYEDYYAGWYGWCVEKVTPANTYASIYYHDPFGAVHAINASGKIYGANVFERTSSEAETVSAVGVTVLSANTTVSIYVNNGKNAFTPSLLTTQTFELPGYYTIPLTVPVVLTQEEFTVGAIYSAAQGASLSLPYENVYAASMAECNPGESFYSTDGVDYRDAYISYGNLSIRALTSSNAGDGLQISLSRSAITVRSGQSAFLRASITPQPEEEEVLTWTSSDQEVVTVNDGMLTAGNPGVAVVTVRTENGVSASCQVTVEPPLAFTVSGSSDRLAVGKPCVFTCETADSAIAKQFSFYFFREGKLLWANIGTKEEKFDFIPTQAGEYLLVAVCRTGRGEIASSHFSFTAAER